MANGYVLFDDALAELSMSEEELKGLMEEGKLRHFMDAGKIKFRREDIDELKASRGIAEETPEEEITLAPPEDTLEEPEIPPLEGEEVPPPPPAQDEGLAVAAMLEEEEPAAEQEALPDLGEEIGEVEEEEEFASLSEFEIDADLEEEGEELSEEEAELLSVTTPGFRTFEEPEASNVGMTVALALCAVFIALGFVSLFSFVMGTNPITFITDVFVVK